MSAVSAILLKASFDMAGLIVMGVLIISLVFRKMTKGTTNHLFLASIFAGMIACVFDVLIVVVDSNESSKFWIYFVHIVYLLFHNLQGPLHLFFVISLTDIWHKIRKSLPQKILLMLPYSLLFLLVATDPITNWIFTVDGGYEHAVLFDAVYVCLIPYLTADFVYIFQHRKQLGLRRIVSLCSMATLVLVAVIIHVLVPVLRVETFAIAISLLSVSVGVQRPEDYIDSYTGLYKQAAYAFDLKRTFENGKHVNIVMLNIGNYPTIQNMIGYESSIELLQSISARLEMIAKSLKCSCMLYYLDRGRFRMVFNEGDRDKAEMAAEYVMNEFKIRSRFNGFDLNLTPYVVLARCPEEIESFKSLMAFGNDFHDKHPYTGQVMKASEVYNAKDFMIQNNIDTIIERALEKNSFQVYYQPIYSTERGKFVSAEALIRLFDEEHGFISPEILITAAEKSGAIHKIGKYVFEEVCKFISSEEYKRLDLDYIEVNLSVAQCMHSDLANEILSTMKKYNVSPDSINLEITETAASYTQRVMTENLNKLSRAGLSFSLDDYGTGYSNMKRVISLPLKIVKLDKSFVDDQHNPKMWIVLQNTVKMLKDMQMEIVVEGIETLEMVETFSSLKCDFIQGYFFSKPVCKEDFVKFIVAAMETVNR